MKNLFLATLMAAGSLQAQTIEEKKQSFVFGADSFSDLSPDQIESLEFVNEALSQKREELAEMFQRAQALHARGAIDNEYRDLLEEMHALRIDIAQIQEIWRKEATASSMGESYALWHQPDSSIFQLVMDYGAPDFLYVVPPEIGMIHCSLNSNLPIPKESWSETLELILSQYGIGVKQLNAYVRELFFMRNDLSGLKAILDKPEDLQLFQPQARICYILTPDSADPRATLTVLQKFSNMATTDIEIIGGKLYITGTMQEVQELMKLYAFVRTGSTSQDFQVVQLSKMDAKEMERILLSAFHDGKVGDEGSSLRVLPLENMAHSLFLSGTKDDVKKAQKLIKEIESQIEDPQEKTVFWYTVKHSDAEELATVLAKVYDLLISGAQIDGAIAPRKEEKKEEKKLPVETKTIKPGSEKKSHKTADGRNNFIVDAKTGAIIMVVEQDALPKIKELLKKLDVPKKMVQIECLLFEKKITNKNKSGLNLLRIGDAAKKAVETGLSWTPTHAGAGIMEFFMSRGKSKSGVPSYDLAYQFLLSQDDVQINASPSITTMNQTPATFAIVEEISIDSGANDKNGRMYNRAQYGIIIEVTPSISMEEGFITLDTDISFDTTKKNKEDRPDVTRRHIKNHVRIADGETLILGGLRQKNSHDNKDSIPFLGEIPGIGKLFGTTDMSDTSTEMFLFITPRIIGDPTKDEAQLRMEELKKRPGDVPEFFHELLEAKKKEKRRFFQGSMTALFGRKSNPTTPYRKHIEEYDGR
ncbi:MAG: type II secretion system protein GspD [Chlamydiales bacterium]|nr:type II secretion system protein GspD [Chlamydiales bacterium]